VNAITYGAQMARHSESGWPLCIDDSIAIQVCWENDTSSLALVGAAEISYRSKPLRGSWSQERNDTVYDTTAQKNPGHSSLTTYKVSGNYRTLVAYASQLQYGMYSYSEYEGALFNRNVPSWDIDNFPIPISEPGATRLWPPGVGSGGQKTGNLINSGDDKIFAVWPYKDSSMVGGQKKFYRTIWYSIWEGADWSNEAEIRPSDTMYWGQDVCPYPDPNHDIHLVYAYSVNDTNGGDITYNV
jgi:hypothetical protein